MILVAHEGFLRWDHWDGAAIADLSFILIRILQQLQSIANLALVKAIRIIRWRGRPCNRLLARALA